MLEVVSNDIRAVHNEPITLDNVVLNDSRVDVKEKGIVFTEIGVYKVAVSAVATSEKDHGIVGIQIASNGVLQGITSIETIKDSQSAHSLATTSLVRCCSVPTVVSIINIGNDSILDMDVIVMRAT